MRIKLTFVRIIKPRCNVPLKNFLRLKSFTFLNFLGFMRFTETNITSPKNAMRFFELPNTFMHVQAQRLSYHLLSK